MPEFGTPPCVRVEIKNIMRTKQRTIEKWWNGLLPVEKYMAHWAVRALKHANDAEAMDIAREVQDMDRTIVRYCKKVERKRRKLYQVERSRAELAVRTGWN